MYTVVLLTAMTAGNTTPDFFFRSGCHGCNGCYGYSCNGCYGSSCYGCSGCNGCYGNGHGGLFNCFQNLFGGCHGCYGGCNGCYGGCYGCYGGYSSYYGGCYGCYGGCYGGSYNQIFTGSTPVYSYPGTNGRPEVIPPPSDKVKEPTKEKLDQVRATVTIEVPAEGKLYIDGSLMKSGSGRRTFQTPALNAGQLYYYDVRVEIVRNGKTIADTQRVILRPGQVATTSFAHLERQGNEPATAQAGQQQ